MSGRSLCEKHYNQNHRRERRKMEESSDRNKPLKKSANNSQGIPVAFNFSQGNDRLKVSNSLPCHDTHQQEESLRKRKAKYVMGNFDCQNEEKVNTDENNGVKSIFFPTRSDKHNNIKEEEGAAKDIVSTEPSIAADHLQKLSSSGTVKDDCNLVLKLPKTRTHSERLKSLTRKTLALLLENLTRKDFIENIVALKVQRCKKDSGVVWKVYEWNPYVLGRADNPDMYTSFLNHLCSLAEEDPCIIDDLFGVAEKGSTGEGDRVEYLFRRYSPNERETGAVFEPVGGIYVPGYSRQLLSPKEWGGMRMNVHLTMSQFVKGKQYLTALKGSALPIAHLFTG